MALFTWQKKPKEDGTEEFTLPDELQTQIKAGADAAAQLPKLTALLEGLQSTMESSTAAQKKKDEDAAAEAARKRSTEGQAELEEKIEELMLSGKTKEAIALVNQPMAREVLLLRADRIKREVFEDGEKFPYYHGDIKKEVDALLDNQPVEFRNNALNVENCYHTILGKHTKELVEGKIKNRFAGSEGGRGTSSGSAGDTSIGDTKKTGVITDDVRRAAKTLGFKPEEYVKILDEEGVGYA
jgi:hypothetical protein